MKENEVRQRNIKKTPEVEVSIPFALPKYLDEGGSKDLLEDSTLRGDDSAFYDAGSFDPGTLDGGGTSGTGSLATPTNIAIKSQTMTQIAGGQAAVDVIVSFSDVPGATNYEARITKITCPSVVVATTATSGANVNSFSSYNITIPSGANVGDLLVLYVTNRTSTAPYTPSGWTYYNESTQSAGPTPVMQTVFYRWCQTGDPGSNVSIGFGAYNTSSAIMAAYTGVDPTFPFSTAASNVAVGTSYTGPQCNPIIKPVFLSHSFGLNVNSGTDPGTVTLDSSLTLDRLDNYGPSQYVASAVGHELFSGGGFSTGRTLTVGNSSDLGGFVIGLNKVGVVPNVNAYRDAVLADNPLAFYMLGETSGTQMTDISGNGRHGTYVNGLPANAAPLINSATTNRAASFTGSNKHGEVAYGTWMNLAQASIEFWFLNTGAALGAIVQRVDLTTGDLTWSIRTRSGTSFAIDFYNSTGGLYGPTGGGPSTIGGVDAGSTVRKYHVVVTHAGTDLSTYVNGVLQSQHTTGSDFYSGALARGLRVCDGFTHQTQAFALYSGALTAAQVQNHYAAAMKA